jgi:hypothetical protein
MHGYGLVPVRSAGSRNEQHRRKGAFALRHGQCARNTYSRRGVIVCDLFLAVWVGFPRGLGAARRLGSPIDPFNEIGVRLQLHQFLQTMTDSSPKLVQL